MDKSDLAMIGILVVFFAVLLSSSMQKSIVNDELAHIPAGVSYLKTGEFKYNPEHPPLIKEISGLFVLLKGVEFSQSDFESDIDEWNFGARFLYLHNSDADSIMFFARLPMILLSLLLGFMIFKWSKELYGVYGGLISLIFFITNPLFLGHGPLVTTDVGVSLFGVIFMYYYSKYLQKITKKSIIYAGIFFGLLLSTKHSGLFFIPIMFICGLIYEWIKAKNFPILYKRLWTGYIINLLLILIGILVLSCTYFLIGSGAYLEGFKDVSAHSIIGHNNYLHGQFSQDGFFLYFPIAFMIKTPIPFIIALLLSIILYKFGENKIKEEIMLIIPAIIFFIAFMLNNINIGIRHILPVYAFLFIFVGRLGTIKFAKTKNTFFKTILLLLILWSIILMIITYPDYLSDFNGIVKDQNGGDWLLDSNIDWGQDLKGLDKWMKSNKIDNITMAYFGMDSRKYRNLQFQELKCGPQSGLIAISINRLYGLTKKESECSKWLKDEPVMKYIGNSIRIYNISEESIYIERQQFLEQKCKTDCTSTGLKYLEVKNNKCRCLGNQENLKQLETTTAQ